MFHNHYLPIYILLWSHSVGDFLSVDAMNRVQGQLHYESMNTTVLIDFPNALQDLSVHVCVCESERYNIIIIINYCASNITSFQYEKMLFFIEEFTFKFKTSLFLDFSLCTMNYNGPSIQLSHLFFSGSLRKLHVCRTDSNLKLHLIRKQIHK